MEKEEGARGNGAWEGERERGAGESKCVGGRDQESDRARRECPPPGPWVCAWRKQRVGPGWQVVAVRDHSGLGRDGCTRTQVPRLGA